MFFEDMVDEVKDRLNLTSIEAEIRIEAHINSRYRRATAGTGLLTSRRLTSDLDLDGATPGTLPLITIEDYEKILKIQIDNGVGARPTTLIQLTWDELSNKSQTTGLPRYWALKRSGAGFVIIQIDGYPATTFTLKLEGYDIADTLTTGAEPYIPTDYHYILIEGAIADELRKMEKYQEAKIHEDIWTMGLSDMRYFLAKSSYLEIKQGKNKLSRSWPLPTPTGLIP